MRFLLLLCFSLTACGSDGSESYYCYYNKNRSLSEWDKIVVISEEGLAREERTGLEFYKTYRNEQEIISVYRESRMTQLNYYILRMDFSEGKASFSYGSGYYRTPQGFEKSFLKSFTPENFNSVNINPELNQHLPPPPDKNYLPITFIKRELACKKMGYIEEIIKSSVLVFLQVLSI